MNGRIKKLRKALDLTQQQFAEQIGSTQNSVGNYETGHRNPSSSVINNICKTFNVREEWLRNGEGEMFQPQPSCVLDLLAKEKNLTYGDYVLIEKYVSMKPEARQNIMDYVLEVAKSLVDYDTRAAESAGSDQNIDIEKKVAEFRQELELQEKATAKSSALPTAKEN